MSTESMVCAGSLDFIQSIHGHCPNIKISADSMDNCPVSTWIQWTFYRSSGTTGSYLNVGLTPYAFYTLPL